MDIISLFQQTFTSPFLALLFFLGYTWAAKTDGVDTYEAAHINRLQTEKMDRDGEIEATGTIQWDKGNDIVSAATLVPGADGNYFDVTATNAITAINATQSQPGTLICLHFNAILTLTHDATDLILPGGANITTAAGDEAIFIEYTTDKWRCLVYTRASGIPLSHASAHENGNADEISVAALSGLLADDQHVLDAEVVTAAKTVKLDDFTTPDDNTDLNASITKHGLMKKLSNNALQFLNGIGNWVESPRVFVGATTRDTTSGAGAQAIAGVGFTPKVALLYMAYKDQLYCASWGADDGNQFVIISGHGEVAKYDIDTTYSIYWHEHNAPKDYKGTITTFGADGVTITWSEAGNPTHVILEIGYIFIG